MRTTTTRSTSLHFASVALLALGLAACGSDPTPRILEFAANPVQVAPGGKTTLRYRVEDAKTVRIAIDGGATILGTTGALEGSVTTPALTSLTRFVLTAQNGSKSATKELVVQMKTGGDTSANIVTFTAAPMTVDPGGSTTLSWTTERAVSGEIRQGEDVLETLDEASLASGTLRVERILAATVFTLAVKGEDKVEATADVTVGLTGGGPMIAAFTLTPDTIIRGQQSTLAWNVLDATNVTITGNLSGTVYSGPQATGSTPVSPRFSELYTLVATDGDGKTAVARAELTVAPPPGATIRTFDVTPTTGHPGALIHVSWVVENAPQGIELTADDALLFHTSELTGERDITVRATTILTLRAFNASLGDDSRSATVFITPSPGANIATFTGDHDTITLGARVRLRWEVANAPDGIDLLDGAGQTLTTTTSTVGHYDVYPEATTTYELRAYNRALGDAQSFFIVNVTPSKPVIVTLEGSPNPAPFGGLTELTWRAVGASTTRVLLDGVELAPASAVGAGRRQVQMGLVPSHVEVQATNAIGTSTRGIDLGVLGPPEITNFAIQPKYYSVMPVTAVAFVWTVQNATDVELWVDGAPITFGRYLPQHQATPGTMTGQVPVPMSGMHVFHLVARNAAGTVSMRRALSRTSPEGTDAHDNPMPPTTILPLLGDGSGYTATIGVSADVDWYSINVPEGGSLYVEVSDGTLNQCIVDLILRIYRPDFSLLFSDDDSGFIISGTAGCPVLDSHTRPELQNLPAGTYYLRVHSFPQGQFFTFDTGPYSIVAWVRAPACGDGVIQANATPAEECDDGNAIDGDGCSPTCTIEPVRELSGPGTQWVIPGQILEMTKHDYYRLDLTQPTYLRAEVSEPAPGLCWAIDPELVLEDAQHHVIGRNDDDGVMACPRIDPTKDAWAVLQPGTYYLDVKDTGDDDLVAHYLLSLDLLPVGCGNGVIEPGETCDDGNTTSGDGCSATCVFEGQSEREGLGNDQIGGAGIPSPTSGGQMLGALGTASDQDWWAVNVPAGRHLDAWLTIASSETCPTTGPNVRLALFDAAGRQLAVDDSHGPGRCGRISPLTTPAAFAMTGGIYYLRVDVTNAAATFPTYFLHVELSSPSCGNGLVEAGEECDDGNAASGDGCSPSCTFELTATAVSAPGETVSATLGGAGRSAAISVLVTRPGQAIEVTTSDQGSTTTCNAVDTSLELYDGTFHLLGRVETGGPVGTVGDCAAIRYPLDAFASNLAVGTYYVVVVSESAASGSVSVAISVHDAICGNALIEDRAGEECDDGNARPGDGCNVTCAFEPLATVNLPTTTPQTFTASITAGRRNAYTLVVGATPVYLHAETFSPNAAAGCATADTVLRITGPGAQVIGVADDGGVGGCSRITPRLPFARLGTGRWLLSVGEFGDDDGISAYALVIDAKAVNTCGNGVREGTEGCDDRNTASGDGCSAACVSEIPPPVPELEPNDGAARAQTLGTLPSATVLDVEGAIGTTTDEDWFTFTVPAPDQVSAVVTSYAMFDDLESCDFDSELWLYHGAPTDLTATSALVEPTIVAYDTNGGFGLCSALTAGFAPTSGAPVPLALAPGTYLVRMRAYHQAASIPGYYLRFDLR